MITMSVSFSDAVWADVSQEGERPREGEGGLLLTRLLAKDFISGLMRVDRVERLTVDQALQHPWISNDQARLDELYQQVCCEKPHQNHAYFISNEDYLREVLSPPSPPRWRQQQQSQGHSLNISSPTDQPLFKRAKTMYW